MDFNEENKEPQKSEKRQFWGGIFTGILLTLLVVSSIYAAKEGYQLLHKETALEAALPEDEGVITEETIEKLRILEATIRSYYYKEDVTTDDMIDGLYKGLVASLGDPYSNYLTEEDLVRMMETTQGVYYGIGAYVQMDSATGMPMISGVIADSPAEEVKLRGGDILYQVEDELMQGLELTDVVSRIKGPEGSTVHITIYREGEPDFMEFDVERRKIESPTVDYEMLDGQAGYLRIREFDDVTLDQFTEALAVLKGSGMKGLILDLRANPGGNLDIVVDIARQMLPKGLVVYTEDRDGGRTEYSCDGTKEFTQPLLVLVDGNSASASEILAGAIKDYGIGSLIGTTTFGKGIVQQLITLNDDSAIKLTVKSYFTPKGNDIHGVGIEPDIVCEFDADAYYDREIDNQLEEAQKVMQEMISKAETQ